MSRFIVTHVLQMHTRGSIEKVGFGGVYRFLGRAGGRIFAQLWHISEVVSSASRVRSAVDTNKKAGRARGGRRRRRSRRGAASLRAASVAGLRKRVCAAKRNSLSVPLPNTMIGTPTPLPLPPHVRALAFVQVSAACRVLFQRPPHDAPFPNTSKAFGFVWYMYLSLFCL